MTCIPLPSGFCQVLEPGGIVTKRFMSREAAEAFHDALGAFLVAYSDLCPDCLSRLEPDGCCDLCLTVAA